MASTNTKPPTDLGVDYSFIAYVLFAVLVGLGSAYYAVKNQKTILAISIVIASIAIFWFFGSRWFNGFKLKQDMVGGVDRTLTWPPQINYCPDFMSLKSSSSGSTTTYYCVDTMGLTTLKPYTGGQIFAANGSSVVNNSDINAIELSPEVYAPNSAALALLKAKIQLYNMSWEGIYDGTSFTGIAMPNPNPNPTTTA